MHGLDYKWQTLIVVAVGTFMVVLDTTIVNIALPKVITVFGSTVDQAQLVLTGYMLALATVMPATTHLTQRYGTKRLYLFTLTMFTIGSMLCGVATSIPLLVAARVIQGLGGGMIQPMGMAMIFSVTPPHERGKVMGFYAMPVMVAPIAGPTVGGYLVEFVDWRWVFFLNVPAGILGVLVAVMLLRDTPIRRGLKFDVVGFVLASACSSLALLAASDAPDNGWDDVGVVLKLVTSAVLLPIFIWWELRNPQPLLNLKLFKIPAFSIAAVVNFATSASMFGALFLLPVFLQSLRGMGAMEAGTMMMPQAVASAVAVIVSGRLSDRIGPRPLILAGLSLLAVATWLLARLDVNTPDSTIRVLLVLRGMSLGFAMMPAVTGWLGSAPPSQMQAASALNNVMRQLYGAFGTAMFASILQTRSVFHQTMLSMATRADSPAIARLLGEQQQLALAHGLTAAQGKLAVVAQLAGQVKLSALVRGFDDCFLIGAIVCLIGLLPAWFMRRPTGHMAVAAGGD